MMYMAVGAGGILGAVLRFLIYKGLLIFGNFFPFGTLFVNLIGCFILGYLQGQARFYELPKWLVTGLGTGLIGAFTTFSTFSMEVVYFLDQGDIILAVSYIIVSSIMGYLLVYLGFSLAKYK